MPSWPSSLPGDFNTRTRTQQASEQAVETAMDIGPPKRRRRTNFRFDLVSGEMYLTAEQATTLDNFWENDLKGGVLPFDWNRDNVGHHNYQMTSPPAFSYPGGMVKVRLELERYGAV